MTFRPTRILAALTFGLALTLLLPGYAPAQPTTDIRAKAAQLEKDLNAANQKVETLSASVENCGPSITHTHCGNLRWSSIFCATTRRRVMTSCEL